MKYRLPSRTVPSLVVPPISGAMIVPPANPSFYPWLPSTWPTAPTNIDEPFIRTLSEIFGTTILGEIENVISDIEAKNGTLEQRGHVVGLALMCALDSISAYGYRGQNVAKFVRAHFPAEYRPYAAEIYKLYRISLVHHWNLFAATIHPDQTALHMDNGTLAFGLLNFRDALRTATEDFLNCLEIDVSLQTNTLGLYVSLKQTARP